MQEHSSLAAPVGNFTFHGLLQFVLYEVRVQSSIAVGKWELNSYSCVCLALKKRKGSN